MAIELLETIEHGVFIPSKGADKKPLFDNKGQPIGRVETQSFPPGAAPKELPKDVLDDLIKRGKAVDNSEKVAEVKED